MRYMSKMNTSTSLRKNSGRGMVTNGYSRSSFIGSLLFIFMFGLFSSSLFGQSGCSSSTAQVLAEYDNVQATWNITSEDAAGLANPDKYRSQFPMPPFMNFTNALGSVQSDSIFCVTNSAVNEGPDIDINLTIPLEARTTCSDVTFTVCRVGDSYNMVFIGVDHLASKYSPYRQAIFNSVLVGIEKGCSKIYMGFTADIEKKHLGYVATNTYAYAQAEEHFNLQVLDSVNRNVKKSMKALSAVNFQLGKPHSAN